MTIYELEKTLKYRREGLGYVLWGIGIANARAIGSCFSKATYPKTPQDMFNELYEQPKGIEMPDFLRDKYYKQKGIEIWQER